MFGQWFPLMALVDDAILIKDTKPDPYTYEEGYNRFLKKMYFEV